MKTKSIFVFTFICFELDSDTIHDVKDTFILVMLLLVIIHHSTFSYVAIALSNSRRVSFCDLMLMRGTFGYLQQNYGLDSF